MRQKKQSDKTIKGLVLELRPDDNQKVFLSKHLNGCRFIYNQYVEEYLNCLKENKVPNYKDYQELRTEYEFLEGLCSWTLQQVLYKFKQTNSINRSKRTKGQKVGLIRFRSKKSHSDYYYVNNVKLSYNPDCKSKSYVKIPKIGLVNFKRKNIKSELLNGKIKSSVVKRSKTGVYKISLCIEVNKVHEDRKENNHIGLDFSLRDFFVDSFGAKAPEFSTKRSKMESLRQKIDSINERISKMRNKSKKKCKVSVKTHRLTIKCNKLYEKVHNVQVDYINKLSRSLCQHNELIVLENLNLTEMSEHTSFKDSKTSTKGGNHGKSVGLLQWSYFLKKLEENAEKFGNVIVYTDKYYPSSQICSKCGQRHPEMKDVTNRSLKCKCGNMIDRDYNSALNLLKFGEFVVYNKSYQTLGKGLSEYKAFKCLDFQDQKHLNYSQVFDCK